MGVHKDILDKDIRIATVVEISANIANGLGVHDINVLGFPVQLPGRHKSVLLRATNLDKRV